MYEERLGQVKVKIEASVHKVLDALASKGFKIVVAVESTLYASCCGGYVENTLKVEAVRGVKETSRSILLKGSIQIYIDKKAFSSPN